VNIARLWLSKLEWERTDHDSGPLGLQPGQVFLDARLHQRVALGLRIIVHLKADDLVALRTRIKTNHSFRRRIRRTGHVGQSSEYPDTPSLWPTRPARRLLADLSDLL